MNIKNKNGSKTVPWGTPQSTEEAPSTLTCCDLSERNALIQLSVVPLIPSKLSFESRWCGTLSKAFEKYKMIRSCWIPLSSDMASSCFKDKSCVSQLLLARKPCWQSVSMVFRSRCFKILFVSMCSCTIQHIQVRETGRYLLAFNRPPFLKIGVTLAYFQSFGTSPLLSALWKNLVRKGAISLDKSIF